MKYTFKRIISLLIALLLATPSFALAEMPEELSVEIESYAETVDQGLSIESLDIELPVEEAGVILPGDPDGTLDQDLDISGGLTLDPGELIGVEPNVALSLPFDQRVTVGDATFAVTAEAGVFPDGAALRVKKVEDDALIQTFEGAFDPAGTIHRLYRIEVLDASDHTVLPDIEHGTPALRVEGLNLPEDARVVMVDEAQGLLFDIEATIKAGENAIEFRLYDMTVYDILSIEPSPVDEDPTEVPAEQPTDQKPSPSGEGGSASALTDEVVPPTDPTPAEGEGEPAEQPADQKPSPSGEGGSASALTDEVVPPTDPTPAEGEGEPAEQPAAGEDEGEPAKSEDEGELAKSEDEGEPEQETTSPDTADAVPPSPEGEGSEDADPQKPSPANEESDSGDPSAGESVQWTDSSEDGSADPRDGGATAPEEVVPANDSDAQGETKEETTSSDPPEGEPASPEGEGGAKAPEEVVPADAGDEPPEQLSVEPVTVLFETTPDDAVVTVRTAEAEAQAIPAQEDGSFLLLPGEYTYSAGAEGYVSVENILFTVSDEPLTLSVVLETVGAEPVEAEPVAFDQSRTVNGVIVTVKADPGVFPANAALSVKRVPVYRQRQADAAIEDVRDEDANVAVSYTFDIKVIDPITREEIQPAEGQTVSVSFALEQVADENLTTSVYHVTEDEATGELTAESLDVNTETTPETGEKTTAVVKTDGFSLYTVEFTYNNLEYVLPGDTSVPMSEILAALGLTGEVTAVKISDESLFSASGETGEWVVTAHRAFSTSEWMKVRINGIVYQITVTDDQPAVAYIESGWDGSRVTSTWRACGDYTTLTSNSDSKVTLNSGWYVLNQNVTYSKCLSISGDTHLILCDNCTLYAEDGIYIQRSATLNVYGQSGTGWIWADLDDKSGPGIGGVNNTVGGNLVIHGGCIYAQGGTNAAGIGGGNHKSGMGDITVYNGRIHAYGGSSGAGIGRGQQNNSLGTLTIYSGTIHAFGGSFAAGIGGGEDRSGYDNLNIYGGTVKAEGGINGAGIGGGEDGDGGGTVNITGGTVTAKGGSDAAGIGGGFNRTGCRQVNITGGTVEASIRYNIDEDDGWAAIGAGHNKSDNGGLTVGDRMKVTAGRSASAATLQAASARVSGCRKYYAKLEHCDRHNSDANMYYTVTATTHTHICKYCNYRETESHDANGAGGTCSKCGYDKNPTIHFDANLGSGTMDDVYVVQGSEYVLPECRFTAPDNQAFKTWSVQIGNGDQELKNPGDTITVTADTTVWAVWGITVNDVVTGGGTVSYERRVYLAGETVRLNVKADTGWELKTLTATEDLYNQEIEIDHNTFIMPDANVTVTAVFNQIDYAVTIDSIAHGKVTADKITAHYRDEVNLTVTPDAGYSLSRLWATYGDGKVKDFSVEAPYSFKMRNCDVTVHATFVLKVTYDCDSGYGTLSGPSSANEAGETITVTATPKENCGLRSLYYTVDTDADSVHHDLNITEAGGTYGITMPASGIAVHADFARKYTITCAEIENGTVKADKPTAYAGETITVTYTPSENDYRKYVLTAYDYSYYEFGRRKWGAYTPVEGGTQYQYTFTMPSSDVTVLGKFTDFSTKTTITIDFCAGHETLAQSFNGLKSISENPETCTVNGTLVTIPVAINLNDSENSVRKQAQISAIAFIGAQLSGRNYIDADEQLYDDYLGTKPLSEYRDDQEVKDEAWGEAANGIYCLLWKEKLTDPVTVTFEPLSAGTRIKKVYGSGSLLNHTDPQPAFTVNGPVTYETYNTSWYVSYDENDDRLGNMAGEGTSITVQGGERYYTRIYLTPDFRHYIADPSRIISVNNDVVQQAWYHCGNSGSADVVAEVQVGDKIDAGVSITGGNRTVAYGDDVVFTATAVNEGENGAWTWSSSDTTVAEIDNNGVVTAHKTGEVKITAGYESDASAGSATVKLYIVHRPVIVTAKDASKPYDGTPLTQPEAEFDGFVGSDSFTVTMTQDSTVTEVCAQPNAIATVNGVDVATGTSSPVEGVEVTTATIIGNYKVITVKGTLTVTKNNSEVTLTAASDSKTYDGAALTNSGVTASGLPTGFTVQAAASGSATDVSDAGVNRVNDGYIIKNADGEDRTDCFTNVKKVDGKLTVNPKSITGAFIIVDSSQVKYTGGVVTVDVRKVIVDGKVLSAEEDYMVSGNTGTEKGSEYVLTVTGRGNYKDTATLKWGIYDEIIAAPAQDVEVTYDGKPHSIKVQLDANLEGHGATVRYRRSEDENYSDGNPEFTEAGIHPVYYKVTCSPLPNYEGMAVVIINKANAVVATPPAAKEGLVYNGERRELITAGTAGDGFAMRYALSTDGTAAPTEGWSPDIPSAIDAEIYYVWYKATGDANHNDSEPKSVEVTVAPKSLTGAKVTLDYTSYIYNGEEKSVTLTGVKLGSVELSAGDYEVSGVMKSADANTYTVTVTGKGNYADTASATWTIAPKTVGLTWASTSFTYDGQSHGPMATATGLASGDACTVSVTGAQKNAGSYTATATGLSNGNYALPTAKTQGFTIRRKAVTVTAEAKSKTYGDANPTLTAKVAGLVSGESESLIRYTMSRAAGENAGSYTITPTGEATQGNYSVTYKTGKLTINRAAATVTADAKAKTYGDADPALTAKVTGLKNGDVASVIRYTLSRASGENVGSYTITPTGEATQGNYTVSYKTGALTVNRAVATVTAEAKSKTYGDADPALTATVSGLKNGDAASVIKYTLSRDAGENVGSYAITPTGEAVQGNYTVIYETGALTINRAAATVTADAKAKTYGDADPALTATVSGLKNGDAASIIKYTLSRAKGENAGSYTVTPTGEATQGNYTVTYKAGKLTINRAAATVTADANSKTYGDADPALTAKVTGLKNGDAASVIKYTLSRAKGENVGRYTVTPTGEAKQGNYTVTYKTGKLTVNRAAATVTADAKSKTYGDADPALTAKVTGLKNGDKASVIKYTLSRAKGEDVGQYAIVPAGKAKQGNYTVTYKTGKLTIRKAAVTVTADAKTKVEGTADPVLTYTATGLVNGDTLTGALTRDPGEAPGTYNINQGTLRASDNYDLTFKGAVLTITAKPSLPVEADYTLLARLRATGYGMLKLSWSKVKGADGYDVFFAMCVKGSKYEMIASVYAPTRTYKITGLMNAASYKAYVKAWKKVKGRKTYIGVASPAVHAITGGYDKKWCNAKSVTVRKTAITLVKGKSSAIKATVTGVKKGRKVLRHAELLRYYSSNANVAKVNSSGKITAVGGGVCKIYVMANNGVKASVMVTVIAEPTKVVFRKAKYSVEKGKKLNLAKQVKLSPSGVTSALTWFSSDPTIATVSSKGVVKGVKKGSATITVRAANGRKSTTTVKVK